MEKKQATKPSGEKIFTKIVVRCLPPTMTEEEFIEQVQPLPQNDYFAFVGPDLTLGPYAYSRVYLNVVNNQDIYIFRDKFDGYVFVDSKGYEYPAVVEFAPYQKIPKSKKKDEKYGTLESEPDYVKFLEDLEKPETVTLPSTQTILEELEEKDKERRNPAQTPLVEYLNRRVEEKAKLRDERREERRKRELERKQKRDEEKTKRMAAIEKGKKPIKEEDEWEEWEDDYEESTYYSRRKDTSWKEKKPFKEIEKKLEPKISVKEKKIEEKPKLKEVKDEETVVEKEPSKKEYMDKSVKDSKASRVDPRLERANREREKRVESKPSRAEAYDKIDREKSRAEQETDFKPDRSDAGKRASVRPEKWPERKNIDEVAGEIRSKLDRSSKVDKFKSERPPKTERPVRPDPSIERADKERKVRQDVEISKSTAEVKVVENRKEKAEEMKKSLNDSEESESDLKQVTETVATLDVAAEKGGSVEPRNPERRERESKADRRLRNKDRPSIEIYRPGMRRKPTESKDESSNIDDKMTERDKSSPTSQDESSARTVDEPGPSKDVKGAKAESSKPKGEVRTRTFRRSVPRD